MTDTTLTIRLNDEEQKLLTELKKFYGFTGQFGEDSRTIKACMETSRNVARLFFGGSLPQLFSGIKGYKEGLENQNMHAVPKTP